MPEVVAERVDPRKVGLYSESQSHKLAGRHPDYVYERKATDESHPDYVGKYLRPHEIGDTTVGFLEVGPWEIVHRDDKDHNAKLLRKRADDGKDVDTTIQHGKLILCRIHKSEFQKYQLIDRLRDEARSKMLSADRASFGRGATMKGGVSTGAMADGHADVDAHEIINRAGRD